MTSLHDSPTVPDTDLEVGGPLRTRTVVAPQGATVDVAVQGEESGSAAYAEQVGKKQKRRPVSAPKSRFRRWLQAQADSPFAVQAMCALSFADSCISPVLPEILLVPMAMSRPEKRWLYAAWASLASVLGGAFGYLLGLLLWTNGLDQVAYAYLPGFTEAKFGEIQRLYSTSAFYVVFLAGFTPLPFKLFTVTAGVCCVDFGTFLLAAASSRTLRFFLEIHLLHRLGMPLMDWIGNKSRLMTWILLVLLGVTIALRLAIPYEQPPV